MAQTYTLRRVMPPEYPFHIGTRIVPKVGADGKTDYDEIPLTENDFLHPQEEDRFLLTDSHSLNVEYLRNIAKWAFRHVKSVKVFADHRIDWQNGSVDPMGPDVVVFEDFPEHWNPAIGTVKDQQVGCRPLAVFEVTSPSTRHIDTGRKIFLYQQVKIPIYVLVDLIVGVEGYILPELIAYRLTSEGYVRIPDERDGRIRLPELKLELQMEGDRVVAYDETGLRIPDNFEAHELAEKRKVDLDRARDQAEKAEVWAMKERAEKEREKARADALAAELAELKARSPGP